MNGASISKRIGSLRLAAVLEVGFAILATYTLAEGPLTPSQLFLAARSASSINEVQAASSIALFLPVYLILLLLLLRRYLSTWWVATSDLLVVGLIGWTLASTAWSIVPDVTLRRAVAVFGTSLFAVYLTQRYNGEDRLTILAWALGLVVICNVLVLAAYPGLVGNGFSGIYSHKNTLGRMMCLATLIFGFVSTIRGSRRILILSFLSVVLMLAAGSATAIVVLATLLGLIPLFRTLARDSRVVVIVGIVALLGISVGVLVAASNAQGWAGALGRDVTLTGRTVLWAELVNVIGDRPGLGYGFNAFWWSVLDGGLKVEGWAPTQAHNGYIDLAIDVGLIGVFLFVLMVGRGMARAVRQFRRRPTPANLWPLILLCFIALYNVTESTSVSSQSLFWVLTVSAVLSVSPRLVAQAEAEAAEAEQAADAALHPYWTPAADEPVNPDALVVPAHWPGGRRR